MWRAATHRSATRNLVIYAGTSMRDLLTKRGMATMAAVLAWVVMASADVARACPGCVSPNEENRQAFVDTTVFLTFLPLLMIGGFIWWLRRRAIKLNALQSAHRPSDALE